MVSEENLYCECSLWIRSVLFLWEDLYGQEFCARVKDADGKLDQGC